MLQDFIEFSEAFVRYLEDDPGTIIPLCRIDELLEISKEIDVLKLLTPIKKTKIKRRLEKYG
jgi:hypothetical protein